MSDFIQPSIRECVVVYVDDDEAAAMLLQAAFAREANRPLVLWFDTEQSAMRYLAPTDPACRPRVDLVVVDDYLRFQSGLDFIAQIRADARLAQVPFLVFASGRPEETKAKAVAAGAAAYVEKGIDLSSFSKAVSCICGLLRSRC